MKTLREMMDLIESAQTVDEGIFDRFRAPKEDPESEAIRRDLMKQDRQQHPDMDDYSWQIGWHYGDGDMNLKDALGHAYWDNPTIPSPAEPRSFKLGFDARKKHMGTEEQLEETTDEAVAKVEQLYKDK